MPTKPIPAQEAEIPLPFPLRGLDLSQAVWQQPPGTTPVGTNVRGYEPATTRQRGGSRPGLARYVSGQVPGGGLIQDLNVVVATDITPPGPPSPVVQTSSGGTGNTGTATDSFTANVTQGNVILVLLGCNQIGSYPTVTDSQGNSYTRINESSFSSFEAAAYLATVGATGPCTITAAVGSAHIDLISFEISNYAGGRESGTNPQGTGSTIAGASWTAAHAPDLVYVAAWTSTTTTITRTAGSGYTDVQTPSTNFAVCLRRISSTGDYGADLAWALSASTSMQGVQGGIKVTS